MTIEFEPLPMQEAVQFWQDKLVLTMAQFKALGQEAKDRAFAISQIAKADELATVYTALEKALKNGTSFGEFKKQTAEIFESRGWSGKRAWRVDNIFRTNIQTAYSVGSYRQMIGMADRGYGEYDAVDDSHTRPIHAGLDDGKIYPLDHPFWDTWWPPNGYRCRCKINFVHKYEVEEEGLTVESEIPTMIEPIDPETGNKLPPVQLLSEPGFNSHPGKNYWGTIDDTLARKAKVWPEEITTAVQAEIAKIKK